MLNNIRKLERIAEPEMNDYLQALRERIHPIKGKASLGEDSISTFCDKGDSLFKYWFFYGDGTGTEIFSGYVEGDGFEWVIGNKSGDGFIYSQEDGDGIGSSDLANDGDGREI